MNAECVILLGRQMSASVSLNISFIYWFPRVRIKDLRRKMRETLTPYEKFGIIDVKTEVQLHEPLILTRSNPSRFLLLVLCNLERLFSIILDCSF